MLVFPLLIVLHYFSKQLLSLQISSHVKAIDSIYQATDFMGIRNISFMVKRIRVSWILTKILLQTSV